MNKQGCKIIGLLICYGVVSGVMEQRLAYGQTSGVMYGDYVGVTSSPPEAEDRQKSTPEELNEAKPSLLNSPSEPVIWEAQQLPESENSLPPLPPPPPGTDALPPPPPPLPAAPESPDPMRSQRRSEAPKQASPSYFGLGGTIGLTGDETALGDGGFSLVSKASFTENISLHNATSFGSKTASMFALTGEVPIRNAETQRILAIPFLGGGTLVTSKDDIKFHGLIVGGVDVPFSRQFMGTIRVNTGFVDGETEVGVVLGVGYRFSLFNLFSR